MGRKWSSLFGVILLGILGYQATANAEPTVRIRGLTPTPPERILLFVVRGKGVEVDLAVLQAVASRAIEDHMHAQIVSLEEAFVSAGSELQARLSECKGEDACYARLVGPVNVQLLLILAISKLPDLHFLSIRLLDRKTIQVLGSSVLSVSEEQNLLALLPLRIPAAVPEALWDPFGRLSIAAQPDGAEVTIEGRPVGISPVPIVSHLLPGTYKLGATKVGMRPLEITVQVERRRDQNVIFNMLEASETQVESSGWLWWVIAGLAAAAGAVIGTAVLLSNAEPVFCSAPTGSDACD